jgi:serine/threonine-protein kinase HipA
MNKNQKTEVLVRGVPAGLLVKNEGQYIFSYYDNYLALHEAPPVSLTLPKRKEPYISEKLFPFFFGMIPEGENRKLLMGLLKIRENDYLQLLITSGAEEAIGAVTVRKTDEQYAEMP